MVVFPTLPSPLRPAQRLRTMRGLIHRRDLAAAAVGALFTCLLLTAWSLATPPAAPAAAAATGLRAAWPAATAAGERAAAAPTPPATAAPVAASAAEAATATAAATAATAAAADESAGTPDSGAGGGAEPLALAGQTTADAGGDGSGGLWMTPAEARLIRAAMWRGMRYLEYGSGGSTLRFGRLAAAAVSVEHDAGWCRQLAPTLAGSPVRLLCVPVPRAAAGSGGWGARTPFDPANYTTFREYVRAPAAVPPAAYDVVLIDGRARVACALWILRKLTRASVVIIHDANRKRYAPVSTYYEEVGRVTSGKGAVVLRPRQRWAGAELSDATINGVYARIDKMRQGWKKK